MSSSKSGKGKAGMMTKSGKGKGSSAKSGKGKGSTSKSAKGKGSSNGKGKAGKAITDKKKLYGYQGSMMARLEAPSHRRALYEDYFSDRVAALNLDADRSAQLADAPSGLRAYVLDRIELLYGDEEEEGDDEDEEVEEYRYKHSSKHSSKHSEPSEYPTHAPVDTSECPEPDFEMKKSKGSSKKGSKLGKAGGKGSKSAGKAGKGYSESKGKAGKGYSASKGKAGKGSNGESKGKAGKGSNGDGSTSGKGASKSSSGKGRVAHLPSDAPSEVPSMVPSVEIEETPRGVDLASEIARIQELRDQRSAGYTEKSANDASSGLRRPHNVFGRDA